MQITWKGQSCFQILASPGKNNPVKIVIDPFSEEIGLKLPKMEADILLASRHSNIKAVEGEPFLIQGTGEYEAKGVFVQGIEAGENTIYTIETEDLRICHLGDFSEAELSEEILEKIGAIDILMIPIGGVSTISSKEALKIISQIEPKITIPMHYLIPKLKEKIEGVDSFLKALGLKSIVPEAKLTIKKKDVPEEEAKIVLLEP